jgi:hypothetical protein
MRLYHLILALLLVALLATLGLMAFQKSQPGHGFKATCAQENLSQVEREACESFK